MTRKLKPATADQRIHAENALKYLRKARFWMHYADTPKTYERLQSTIKSAEGSLRHLDRRVAATQRGAT